MSTDMQQIAPETSELPCLNLEGKRALVTGGSRGIGKAIALTLASQGADVGITYYTGCKFAEDVRDQIRSMGREAGCYSHDVGDRETVDELRPQVLEDFGQVDILVNNAGIARDRSFKKMTIEMWDDVLEVDLTGLFHVTKQFIDDMGQRGWGRVINISSIVGEVGTSTRVPSRHCSRVLRRARGPNA